MLRLRRDWFALQFTSRPFVRELSQQIWAFECMYQSSDRIPPRQVPEITRNTDCLPHPKDQENPNSKRPRNSRSPKSHLVPKVDPVRPRPANCFAAGSRKASAVKIPNLWAPEVSKGKSVGITGNEARWRKWYWSISSQWDLWVLGGNISMCSLQQMLASAAFPAAGLICSEVLRRLCWGKGYRPGPGENCLAHWPGSEELVWVCVCVGGQGTAALLLLVTLIALKPSLLYLPPIVAITNKAAEIFSLTFLEARSLRWFYWAKIKVLVERCLVQILQLPPLVHGCLLNLQSQRCGFFSLWPLLPSHNLLFQS